MKTNKIRKIFKTFIFIIVIMFIPLILTSANSQAIYYELAEDKSNAVIHIDVNKVIGSNDLIEVKNQDSNLYFINWFKSGIYRNCNDQKVKEITVEGGIIE